MQPAGWLAQHQVIDMYLILWAECHFREASQEAGTVSDWHSAAEPHGGKSIRQRCMPCICAAPLEGTHRSAACRGS